MIKYYDFKGEVAGSYKEKPKRKFHFMETHYIDEKGKKVNNPDFDLKKAQDSFYGHLKSVSNGKLKEAAMASYEASLPNSRYTAAQKNKIKAYRKELTDYPNTIKANGYKHSDLPEKPEEM